MKNIVFAMLLAAAAPVVQAQVDVREAWVRATVPSARSSGLFMRITSSQDAQLVEVRSSAAGVAEIHQMKMDGQMMRMHAVPAIDLPAGQAVNLAAGGYHVMLMDLKQPLNDGDTVPVTLTFEDKAGKRQTVEVKAAVRGLTAGAPPAKPGNGVRSN